MALTQVSTDGIKNGTITGSDLATSVDLIDNQKIRFGTGNDLEIVHNSSETHFNVSANTFFKGNIFWGVRNSSNQGVIEALTTSRTVDLYGGSTKVLSTSSTGVTIRQGFNIQNSEFNMTTNGTKILDFETGGTNSVNFRHNPSDSSLSNFMKAIHGGAVELYHDADGSKKFETTSVGFNGIGDNFNLQASDSGSVNLRLQNTGTGTGTNDGFLLQLDSSEHAYIWHRENKNMNFGTNDTLRFLITNDGDVRIPNDSGKLQLGVSQDLQIYHDGSKSVIADVGTGGLFVAGSSISLTDAGITETMLYAVPNGAVELYHDNIKRLSTTSTGAEIFSTTDATFKIHNTAGSSTSRLTLSNTGSTNCHFSNTNSELTIGHTVSETEIKAIYNGAVELYHNNLKKFETTSNGAKTSGVHLIENANDSAYNPTASQGGARLTIHNTDNSTSDTFADISFICHTTSQGQARIGMELPSVNNSELFFVTESSNNLSERMRIQSNGEIAMRSNGTPSDALANLHVQNDTFRVSNDSDGADTTYLKINAFTDATDDDRWSIGYVSNNEVQWNIRKIGTAFFGGSIFSGRTRNDQNNPVNVYRHGSHSVNAYSGRTDDTSGYRSGIFIRAWDAGDDGDRNVFYYTNSGSDTTTVDYDQHQRAGIKADGAYHGKSNLFGGRVESDENVTNNVYRTGDTSMIVYNTASFHSAVRARDSDNTEDAIRCVTGGGPIFKVETSGRVEADGTYASPATDYAEYFEWTDGNTNNADRRGITVVMDGEKIRPATDSDNTSNIIGVVSALPSVVGDDAWSEWQLAHLKDAYGSWVTEDKEYLVWNKFGTDFIDGKKVTRPQPDVNDYNVSPEFKCLVSEIEAEKAKGNVPQAAIDQNLRITRPSRTYNPDYDPTRTYIPRSQRKEWDPIGLLGKLVVRRGQPIGANWILMKSNVGVDPTDNSIVLDKYFVR